MFPIRKHFLASGFGLDRRKLVENFNQVARLFSRMRDSVPARKGLYRLGFQSNAFRTFFWTGDDFYLDAEVLVPMPGKLPGEVSLVIDGDADILFYWSLSVKQYDHATDPFRYLLVVPYCDDIDVWSACDAVEHEFPFTTIYNRRDLNAQGQPEHTLCGEGSAGVRSGEIKIGLKAVPHAEDQYAQWDDSLSLVGRICIVGQVRYK